MSSPLTTEPFFISLQVHYSENPYTKRTRTSNLFVMLGTLFLWVYWPSINAPFAPGMAKAGKKNYCSATFPPTFLQILGSSQYRVIVNTVLAMTVSVVTTFVVSSVVRPGHRFNFADIQSATMAGKAGCQQSVGACHELCVSRIQAVW